MIPKNPRLFNKHSVSITEVLTPSFISQHTRFSDANAMFEATGFKIESQEDFQAIPDDKLDEFIRSESSFSTWRDMLSAAMAAWTKKKLGL